MFQKKIRLGTGAALWAVLLSSACVYLQEIKVIRSLHETPSVRSRRSPTSQQHISDENLKTMFESAAGQENLLKNAREKSNQSTVQIL